MKKILVLSIVALVFLSGCTHSDYRNRWHTGSQNYCSDDEKVYADWFNEVAKLAGSSVIITKIKRSRPDGNGYGSEPCHLVFELSDGSLVGGYLKRLSPNARLEFLNWEPDAIYPITPLIRQILDLQDRALEKRSEPQRLADKAFEELPIVQFPYEALISCQFMGNSVGVEACFAGDGRFMTNLELTNGKNYGMYQYQNLANLGRTVNGGVLIVPLSQTFKISAQNAANQFVLNIITRDRASGQILDQKSVERFGFITFTSGTKRNNQNSSESKPKIVYEAIFSCTSGTGKVIIDTCFAADSNNFSTLEVRNGSKYKMYQYGELRGQENFLLQSNFEIRARNASNQFILNLKIKNISSGEIIFQKSVGIFGIISVKN